MKGLAPPSKYLPNQATRWADGLRGIAAIGVVSSHLTLSFARQYAVPCYEGRDGPSLLFQKPIFRLIVQGQSFVALFFILMGFVNSLKPLKQAHANQIEDALLTLARSSLNRTARLFLPATVVTVLTWLGCQLHFFEVARKGSAYWLQVNSRPPSQTWGVAVTDLIYALRNTWVWGDNPYDQPQWALRYLLLGSMWIFLALLITVTTRPAFRFSVIVLLYIYSWTSGEFLVGFNVYFGMFLAQVHTSAPTLTHTTATKLFRWAPFLFALLGLYLMSFPSEYAQDAPWSRNLDNIGRAIIPDTADISRFWAGLGAQLLCLSIHVSPELQHLLSSKTLGYLGSVSFSLYLLHGPLMRSVLACITFAPAVLTGAKLIDDIYYPLPSSASFLFILPVFGVFLMMAVHLWSTIVEPIFAKWTKDLEELATGTREVRSPIYQNGKG